MPNSFADNLVLYQSNVLQSLLEKLAEQLSVSTESLLALEIGYALRVPIKKNKAFNNCWVFPERNSEGDVIGLSLRDWRGKKFMVPGSRRGLIYIPGMTPGPAGTAYQAGPQNWTRTSEKIACPICGKNDWCLVSSEDVDDPKAVLCCREQKGSTKDIGDAGYLHIRKPEGDVGAGGSALQESELPILIVEGATDVAAAADLGFFAVGRPSGSGSLKMLAELVAGRNVIVLGENDAGAGVKGMEKTFENVKGTAASAMKLLPPEGIKDLRSWVRRGITQEKLLQIAESAGTSESAEAGEHTPAKPNGRNETLGYRH